MYPPTIQPNHYSDLYCLAFSNDSLTRKILVYGVYAIELVQTILFTIAGFRQLGTGFGNLEALSNTSLLWFAVPIFSSIGVLISSLDFYGRLRVLTSK